MVCSSGSAHPARQQSTIGLRPWGQGGSEARGRWAEAAAGAEATARGEEALDEAADAAEVRAEEAEEVAAEEVEVADGVAE